MTTSVPATPEPTPGASLRAGVKSLACGADIDELLEQVADGQGGQLTAHQQHCEYCQAALTEFTGLWSPITRAAAAPVSVPLGLVGTLTAAVTASILNSQAAAAAPARLGLAGRRPPLRHWLPLAVAVLAVTAIITAIVLVSQHHRQRTGAPVVVSPAASTARFSPAPTATGHPVGPAPSATGHPVRPVPTSTAPRYPTAVPAGTGGQAATAATIHNEQLAALLAGLLLIAAGGGYLLRRRR